MNKFSIKSFLWTERPKKTLHRKILKLEPFGWNIENLDNLRKFRVSENFQNFQKFYIVYCVKSAESRQLHILLKFFVWGRGESNRSCRRAGSELEDLRNGKNKFKGNVGNLLTQSLFTPHNQSVKHQLILKWVCVCGNHRK